LFVGGYLEKGGLQLVLKMPPLLRSEIVGKIGLGIRRPFFL
jgi:hypothetical protein